MPQESRKSGAVAVVVLLVVIAILLLLIVWLVVKNGPNSGSSGPSNGAGRPFETTRIQQTYQPGRTYRSVLQVSVNARATHKDWGINTDSYMQFISETEIERKILSNDGTTIVLEQEFTRARTIAVSSELSRVRIALPGVAQGVLDLVGGYAASLPPGWTEVSIRAADQILSTRPVLNALQALSEDPTAQARLFLDSLEGIRVRITYVNGKGVTAIQPLHGELSDDIMNMIRTTSIISDAYVLPDLSSRPGDVWTIHGPDMLPIMDPSLRAAAMGRLTARRGNDGGTAAQPTAEVLLDDGVVEFRAADGTGAFLILWAPQGNMTFDFTDNIVTYAELGGQLDVEKRSTDHWIFEARWAVEPEYKVMYYNTLMP